MKGLFQVTAAKGGSVAIISWGLHFHYCIKLHKNRKWGNPSPKPYMLHEKLLLPTASYLMNRHRSGICLSKKAMINK